MGGNTFFFCIIPRITLARRNNVQQANPPKGLFSAECAFFAARRSSVAGNWRKTEFHPRTRIPFVLTSVRPSVRTSARPSVRMYVPFRSFLSFVTSIYPFVGSSALLSFAKTKERVRPKGKHERIKNPTGVC